MKNYIVELETVTKKTNSETRSRFRTELDLHEGLDFSEIVEFMDQVKTIWKKAMQASRRGDYMDMEVIAAEYEGVVGNLKQDLMQKNFDRWHFSGVNGDEEGIYLDADARYTSPSRDMFLTKDVLKDLCLVLGH